MNGGADGEEGAGDEVEVVRFGLRTPQPWISMGSEFEVEDEKLVQTEEKVKNINIFVDSVLDIV